MAFQKMTISNHEQHNFNFDPLAFLMGQTKEVVCLDCNVAINVASGAEWSTLPATDGALALKPA
jgi:hypothetical protein